MFIFDDEFRIAQIAQWESVRLKICVSRVQSTLWAYFLYFNKINK